MLFILFVLMLNLKIQNNIKHFRYFFIGLLLFISCSNEEQLCACTKEYMPVIAGGEQYNNFCLATCAGYDEDEITILNN